jgi:hypothetical protein
MRCECAVRAMTPEDYCHLHVKPVRNEAPLVDTPSTGSTVAVFVRRSPIPVLTVVVVV